MQPAVSQPVNGLLALLAKQAFLLCSCRAISLEAARWKDGEPVVRRKARRPSASVRPSRSNSPTRFPRQLLTNESGIAETKDQGDAYAVDAGGQLGDGEELGDRAELTHSKRDRRRGDGMLQVGSK